MRCVYVTNGWGIHDERWFAALKGQGFSPAAIRMGIDVTSTDQLPKAVTDAALADTAVLAGPLNSVTVHLAELPNPIVGLSWGFDLHEMVDLAWLTQLSGIIVDSEATGAIARTAGMRENRIIFLPWGVDLQTFRPDGPKQDLQPWGIPAHARVLLSLRAHEEKYRVADIINAMPEILTRTPHAFLLVGNSGSQTPELQEISTKLGLDEHLEFIGRVDESALPELFRATDVYISASEVDGTSVTLLQAMACGTPVAVSDIPGNRPWVTEGISGHTFPVGDTARLADAIENALNQGPRVRQEALIRISTDADWSRNRKRLAFALRNAVN